MPGLRSTQRIIDVVRSIDAGEFRLPSIQRSFVWGTDRTNKLFDSLMRDYPIGSFLLWKPTNEQVVRTRRFVKDYATGVRIISDEEQLQPAPYLTLDGQQRLQSLYLGFFGKYDGKTLFFKVDSDPKQSDSDNKFLFEFLTPTEASRDPHWLSLTKILQIEFAKIGRYVDSVFTGDPVETRDRIKDNLAKFVQVFGIEEKLPVLEVKEGLPYDDVLEIFVRINSGGIILTKSDLVFSTVVLKLPDMERKFVELTDLINGGGEYDFDIDFIVRTSFVLLGIGAEYAVTKLQDGKYLSLLQSEFEKIRQALLSTVHFLKNDAKILTSRLVKSDLALIPIVDFLYRQSHQQLPEGQASLLRRYLLMSFFMRFYSHGADGKLDAIHGFLAGSSHQAVFPITQVGQYMEKRTGIPFQFSESMLNNVDVVLNVIQGGVSEIPKMRGWSLEKDHIFSQNLLETHGFPEEEIDRVGNLRFLNKTRNILKSSQLPAADLEFFGHDSTPVANKFAETRNDLTREIYRGFCDAREHLMMNTVRSFLGFT